MRLTHLFIDSTKRIFICDANQSLSGCFKLKKRTSSKAFAQPIDEYPSSLNLKVVLSRPESNVVLYDMSKQVYHMFFALRLIIKFVISVKVEVLPIT